MTRYFVRLSRMETAHFEIEVEAPDAEAAKLAAIEAYNSGDRSFTVCPDCHAGEIEIREEPSPIGGVEADEAEVTA